MYIGAELYMFYCNCKFVVVPSEFLKCCLQVLNYHSYISRCVYNELNCTAHEQASIDLSLRSKWVKGH